MRLSFEFGVGNGIGGATVVAYQFDVVIGIANDAVFIAWLLVLWLFVLLW